MEICSVSKEFTNYVNKKNSGPKGEVKDPKKRIAGIEAGTIECEDKEAEIAACKAKIVEAENKLFKPIIGCEMYVARRTMDLEEGKPDQSGYHRSYWLRMKLVITTLLN